MEDLRDLVKSLYKNPQGDPLILTDSQLELFDMIFRKRYKRNHIMTYTQFGKSMVSAIGVLTRITTFPESYAIVGPTKDKAKIIMNYIIKHTFDNPYLLSKLEIEKGESLERIRRERSKDKLTFKIADGKFGEVVVLSAEAGRQANVEKALMGYGAPNVLEDESALIPDNIHSTVMRMVGGHTENWIGKIGNPFKRNHFLRSSRDEEYHKFLVTGAQGVKEGRITQEFLDEMKSVCSPQMYDILYNVKFPDEEGIDEKGYMPLITEKQLGLVAASDIELFGELRLGVDVAAGGRNKSAIVLRGSNGAKLLYHENNPDTMALVGEVLKFKDEYKVLPENIFVDAVGVGKGAVDRLQEEIGTISPVTAGKEPENKEEQFADLRAQMFWRMSEWIKSGMSLVGNFTELLDIKYKVQSDKKIRIKPKQEMLKEGILSPDVADALAMTFTRERPAHVKKYKPKPFVPISEYQGR